MEVKNNDSQGATSRRNFIGTLTATAAMSAFAAPLMAKNAPPQTSKLAGEADAWFKKVKGSHRVVYDAPEPHNGFPFIWSWAYYLTNNETGTPDSDMTAMVVLRHNAIPFAMEDSVWKKYKLGETFKISDSMGAPSIRNPYYMPKEGDYPLPGIDGIKRLQERGAMVCVCNLALTVYSGMVAQAMELDAKQVKQDWDAAILPGIQPVPSGVWALGRAQEHGCGYIYAGG